MGKQVDRFRARESLKDLLLDSPRPYRVIEAKLESYRKTYTEDNFYQSYRRLIEDDLRSTLLPPKDI